MPAVASPDEGAAAGGQGRGWLTLGRVCECVSVSGVKLDHFISLTSDGRSDEIVAWAIYLESPMRGTSGHGDHMDYEPHGLD